MSQPTCELILEYGRTLKGTPAASRARKRLRQRARAGDELAVRFLSSSFNPGSVVMIERQLLAWLGRWA